MGKHLSVLMLFIRSMLYRFLLLLLAMAVVESLLFALAWRNATGVLSLDALLLESQPQIAFAVAFLLLCALFCLTGCEFGSKQGYTLNRLRVSHRAVFLWQSAANAGLLFLFWAAQVGLILAFCAIYSSHYPQPQAAMLAFYANDFLHSLLPLAETNHLVGNLALLLALALTAACFPIRQRRGERPLACFAVVLLALFLFIRTTGSFGADIWLIMLMLVISGAAILGIWGEADHETVS